MHHPCKPCPPPRPAPCSQGVLLPRIIAHENRCIPRLCTQLCLKGLPECTCPPLCLRSLQPAMQPPEWTVCDLADACGRQQLLVRVPVSARLCDGCGNSHCASGVVEATVFLSSAFAQHPGRQIHIEPRLQLLCAEPACTPGCFEVQVHLSLEIYLLKPEVFATQIPKPACPGLPLYPPPIR